MLALEALGHQPLLDQGEVAVEKHLAGFMPRQEQPPLIDPGPLIAAPARASQRQALLPHLARQRLARDIATEVDLGHSQVVHAAWLPVDGLAWPGRGDVNVVEVFRRDGDAAGVAAVALGRQPAMPATPADPVAGDGGAAGRERVTHLPGVQPGCQSLRGLADRAQALLGLLGSEVVDQGIQLDTEVAQLMLDLRLHPKRHGLRRHPVGAGNHTDRVVVHIEATIETHTVALAALVAGEDVQRQELRG
ncbi:hypothetical protein LN139_04855 [Pseudomonas sp. KNUC1026]|nr:hypothetical protein [Pseudomonas sp. KNUC1026]UFH50550.1 hypothetical protein LN139_04855 [Pseudomonas sp. KNUC1026]